MDTKRALLAIAVIAILGFAGMQVLESRTQSGETIKTGQAEEATNSAITGGVTPEAAQVAYKNGTYSAIGNYQSPAGKEEIDIKVTVKDGVITDSEFEGKGVNPTTKKMQGLFAEGYKTQVVGKSLDEVSLDVVNGSSLTPKGFEDALQKIRTEAAAS